METTQFPLGGSAFAVIKPPEDINWIVKGYHSISISIFSRSYLGNYLLTMGRGSALVGQYLRPLSSSTFLFSDSARYFGDFEIQTGVEL